MKISFDINLSAPEKTQLATILRCKETELDTALAPFSLAALHEYLDMFFGERAFTRGSDIREYRLLLLIRDGYKGQIPDEQTVSELFQTTAAQSKSLINSVLSKYQYELKTAIDNLMIRAIKAAVISEDETHYTATIVNSVTVDRLNRILVRINGNSLRITKMPGTVSIYQLQPSAYDDLCKHFGIKTTGG